jgi:hypothetical protein
MKSLISALLSAILLFPAVAWADDAQASAQGCGLATGALISQDQGQVLINCAGVTEEFGGQLAGILTYVLQRRLDPELVIAKLDEVDGVPAGNTPRNLTSDQGQAIVQGLAGGAQATIAISADPEGAEPGNYALAIGTRLGLAGWLIQDRQINRVVPPGLDDIRGAVIVVHDEKSPPDTALRLKKAMTEAKIFLPIISRPETIKPGAVMLWIGKRPVLNAAAQTATQ